MSGALRRLRVKAADRCTLSARFRPPDGDAPVVMFSNSLAADQSMWDRAIAALPRQIGVLAYDSRGHGDSDVCEAGFTIADLGRDCIALISAAGVGPVHFCGLSLGGLTAMWLGLAEPKRLTGLTLANTATVFPPPTMWLDRAAHARSKGMDDLVAPTLERWLTTEFRAREKEATDRIARMIGATPAEGYAACCQVLATTDMTGPLAELDLPLHVIAGSHDSSAPVSAARAIIEAAGHGELTVLDAAHLSAFEQPELFARSLLQAMERA